MHTINLNTPLVNTDGTTNEAMPLCRVLADILGTETEGRTLKLYGWYKALQASQALQLDDADLQELRNIIDTNKRIFLYVKGQLLEAIK